MLEAACKICGGIFFSFFFFHSPIGFQTGIDMIHSWVDQLDGLVQERRNSIANALGYVSLALNHRNVMQYPSLEN